MISYGRILMCGVVAASGVISFATSAISDEYFKDKTITFYVGYSPGGGSDLTGRLVARHLNNHLPGKPTIIVKNMPGAGGVIAFNYVGKSGKRDGSIAYWGSGPVIQQLLDDPALQVDLSKFEMIAGTPGNQVFYVRSDAAPGIKQPMDIFAAEELSAGGFQLRSNKDLAERLGLQVLGVKFKYVTGFKGNSQARAGVQQGLINGFLEGLPSYLGVTVPTMVETGMVTPVYQLGVPNEAGDGQDRDEVVPDVPTVSELYEKKFGKKPSGKLWEAYLSLTAPYSISQRFLAVPPGTSKEAVDLLRAGMLETAKDPAFQKEMVKVIKYKLPVYSGQRAAKAIEQGLNSSPEVKAYLKQLVAEGKKQSVR